MSKSVIVTKDRAKVEGTIQLDGSKSISNRALIIQALCKEPFTISGISSSDDSSTLAELLQSEAHTLDAHHAGTTYRFMTAYLAVQGKHRILTGSERMQERPIGPLVEALRSIGADIRYTEKEGYPPLEFGERDAAEFSNTVTIAGTMSSQYISALLMIAPTLSNGLTISIEGDLVSRPYLEMTLQMMQYFGVESTWKDESTIEVLPQAYQPRDFHVEADWSAASYYYSICALAEEAHITLKGLHKESMQGDSAIAKIASRFGVETSYADDGSISITKNNDPDKTFEYDFLLCPDLAQTVAVMSAGSGGDSIFTGLQTLKIKETDRIAALKTELLKVQSFFTALPSKFSSKSNKEYYMLSGKANSDETPSFETYKDHRMAMAFAPLALKFPIQVEQPGVVSKSYPKFWEDLESLGFELSYS